MRRNEYIKEGSHIETSAGELVVTSYNGSIVYCDEYIINEDDELVLDGERRLTLSEIGMEMKQVDGRNHTVRWEEV